MKVRKAEDQDAERIAELISETVKEVNATDYADEEIAVWSDTDVEKLKDAPEEKRPLVAVKDGRIVGFGELEEDEITGLYVDHRHQGEGIGARLLSRIEEIARENDIETIELKSTITAKQFYENHGYTVIGETVREMEDQELDCYKMEKALD